MKNYEKAQFLIEQLSSDGFKFGNAFFHRLEVALDKLDAAEHGVQADGSTTDGELFHAVLEMVNPDNPHWRKTPRR